MKDAQRAGIALILIVLGFNSFGLDENPAVVVRTVAFFAGYLIMLPLFIRKYRQSPKDWRSFLALSALGATIIIANLIYNLMK